MVRHVILTVGRDKNPAWYYEVIRYFKDIPRLAAQVEGAKDWLWALEFHHGGWPHWHLIIEREQRGMITHAWIKESWKYGHVWESPIYGERHWRAIVGYHQSKGYLAGEKKAHQLELPPFLAGRSRVRKFGAKQRPSGDNVPRGTLVKTERAQARPYAERFQGCGEGSRINNNGRWQDSPADCAIITGLSEHYSGARVNGEFDLDAEDASRVIRQAEAYEEESDLYR